MAMRSEYPVPDPAPSAESTSTVAAPAARPRLRLVRTGITDGDRAALRHFFRDHEAECGLRSTFVDPRTALCRAGGFDSGLAHARMLHLAGWSWDRQEGMPRAPDVDRVDEDGRLVEEPLSSDDVALFRRHRGPLRQAGRVRAILGEMQRRGDGALVSVLFLLYGPGLSQGQDPEGERRRLLSTTPRGPAWSWAFLGGDGEAGPELARIAHLTDVAERWCEELSLRVGEEREAVVAVDATCRLSPSAAADERRFWETAGRVIRAEDRRARLLARAQEAASKGAEDREALAARSAALGARLAELRLELESWMKGALYHQDERDRGIAAARTSACASADYETTTADAILDRLGGEALRAPGWKAAAKDLVRAAQKLRADAGAAFCAARDAIR